MPTRDAVIDALSRVIDPIFDKPMLEIETLGDVSVAEGVISARATLSSPVDRVRALVDERIRAALAPLGADEIAISYDVQIPTREVMGDDPVPEVRNILLVMSGKGGVGKSTTA